MDPFAPIEGLTLERFVEVAVAIGDDPGAAARAPSVLAHAQIGAHQWEAARHGWSARLSHPAVAQAHATLRQSALQRRMGQPPAPPAQDFGGELGRALGAFGNALGAAANAAVGALSVGARVQVAWSDGRRYPATVVQMHGGQALVSFPDGQQQWVPSSALSLS
jgi:hypothetical protein